MENILELFYDMPVGWGNALYGPDSEFESTDKIKNQNLDLLMEDLTEKQKEWFRGYRDADGKIARMIHTDEFSYAFHLGAQLMLELTRGKERLLGE